MRLSNAPKALALALAFPAAALANDTTASFTAGGLVLEKTDDIAMRSEDLFLSTDEVRVSYVFRNTSNAPITTRVAFPLPEIVYDAYGNLSIPSDDPKDPVDFRTVVDGRPVTMALDEKATSREGVDITGRLTALGVPLAPWTKAVNEALDGLPQAEKDRLVADNLASQMEYDEGQGLEIHLEPAWNWSGTYHWEQTFEPGTDLAVEHSYKPSVGGAVGTVLHLGEADYGDAIREMRETYCIDDAFMAAVARRTAAFLKTHPDYGYAFNELNFGYVLTTGANWSEPIGDFKLTVDKGAPENLVSFCADGVKKVSPTQFQVEHGDFTPTRDLAILILTPQQL